MQLSHSFKSLHCMSLRLEPSLHSTAAATASASASASARASEIRDQCRRDDRSLTAADCHLHRTNCTLLYFALHYEFRRFTFGSLVDTHAHTLTHSFGRGWPVRTCALASDLHLRLLYALICSASSLSLSIVQLFVPERAALSNTSPGSRWFLPSIATSARLSVHSQYFRLTPSLVISHYGVHEIHN